MKIIQLYEKRGYVTKEHCKWKDVKGYMVRKVNDNGELELHEEWQWMNGDSSTGKSIVTEQ